MRYVDPDGRTNYIFYDEENFSKQAGSESKRIPVTDNEATLMIPIKSEEEFKNAWNQMENATDVSLFFHGSAKTLNLDWKKNEYLTANDNGKTPKGADALYIGDLNSKEIGTLKIFSCQSGNVKEKDNIANCFDKNNKINSIYATDGNLSYLPFIFTPRISIKGKNEYKEKYGQNPKGFIKVK